MSSIPAAKERLVFSHCHACSEKDDGQDDHDPGVGCHADGPSDGCEGVWVSAASLIKGGADV